MIWFILLVVITIIAFWIKSLFKQTFVADPPSELNDTRISQYQKLMGQMGRQLSELAAAMNIEGAPIALKQVEDFRKTHDEIMGFRVSPADGHPKEFVDLVASQREIVTSTFSQIYEPASIRALSSSAEFKVLNEAFDSYNRQYQVVVQATERGLVTQAQVSTLQELMDDLKRAKSALSQYPAAAAVLKDMNLLEQSFETSAEIFQRSVKATNP